MEDPALQARRVRAPWWRLPLLLSLVLATILWYRLHRRPGIPQTTVSQPAQTAPAGQTLAKKVLLAIVFGPGSRKDIGAIAWHDGMTVADLLNESPGLRITQKGSGQSTFLTAIDGIQNQGESGDNWTYAVNGKIADRSFAIYQLQPGDQVLWTFGPQR